MTIIVAVERMKQDGGVAYNFLKQEGVLKTQKREKTKIVY